MGGESQSYIILGCTLTIEQAQFILNYFKIKANKDYDDEYQLTKKYKLSSFVFDERDSDDDRQWYLYYKKIIVYKCMEIPKINKKRNDKFQSWLDMLPTTFNIHQQLKTINFDTNILKHIILPYCNDHQINKKNRLLSSMYVHNIYYE